MTDEMGNLVTIRDIDVPFWRIVMIMIKWSIAAIPATIILVLAAGRNSVRRPVRPAYADERTRTVGVTRPSAPGRQPRRAS